MIIDDRNRKQSLYRYCFSLLQPSLSHYRNSVSENCQSPTSPHSQPSYSPSQSPGLPPSTWNNFTDNYHLQHQQQTQALQHQFEQFKMVGGEECFDQCFTDGNSCHPLAYCSVFIKNINRKFKVEKEAKKEFHEKNIFINYQIQELLCTSRWVFSC